MLGGIAGLHLSYGPGTVAPSIQADAEECDQGDDDGQEDGARPADRRGLAPINNWQAVVGTLAADMAQLIKVASGVG